MLEGKNYRALETLFPLVAAFIDRGTENKKSAPKKRVHTRFREIVSDAAGHLEQQAWSVKRLDSLERSSKTCCRDL